MRIPIIKLEAIMIGILTVERLLKEATCLVRLFEIRLIYCYFLLTLPEEVERETYRLIYSLIFDGFSEFELNFKGSGFCELFV